MFVAHMPAKFMKLGMALPWYRAVVFPNPWLPSKPLERRKRESFQPV
jgi:hypothetical protein